MPKFIFSILLGTIAGIIYSFLFFSGLNFRYFGSRKKARFDFWQLLTFIARFIFIIVVAVVLPVYFNVDLLWFLLSLGITFWGFVLTKLGIIK